MKHVYVYYRVRAGESAALRVKIARLLAEVEQRTGVRGRLSHRCNDASTWMEIYEPVDDTTAFANTLAGLAVRSDLDAHLAPGSSRQMECFADAGAPESP